MFNFDIENVAEKINKEGGRLYLVGGALRDKLLGCVKQDEDYLVTGLSEEEFLNLFPEAIPRGKSFKVFEICKKEFALARTETKIGLGHKEFRINTSKDIKIEEDLKRRDITINSIAQDVLTKEIIDPYDGVKDLASKVIRATSDAFSEDPLRVYRVARLMAFLNSQDLSYKENVGVAAHSYPETSNQIDIQQNLFTIDKNTLELMYKLKGELNTLSKERVFTEFKKALQTSKPSIFFDVLRKADVLEIHFKEIYDLIGSLQPQKYHPEGDSYNHTMLAVNASTSLTEKLEIRYSVLVHDLGKGITPKEEYPHHYEHDKNGPELVKNLSNTIGVPTVWKKCGKTSAGEHMRAGIFSKMKPEKKVDLIEKLDKSLLGLDGMEVVVKSDKCMGRKEESEKCQERIDFARIGKKMISKINGEYVYKKYGRIEGKKFGEILRCERIKWMKTIENL